MKSKFYNWGNNCKLLGYSLDETLEAVEEFSHDFENSEDYDDFWYGYHYGNNTEIVPI